MNNLVLFVFDKSCLTNIQNQLSAQFKMTNLGEVSYYLGIEVEIKVEEKISLCQITYHKKILDCFQIIDHQQASFS